MFCRMVHASLHPNKGGGRYLELYSSPLVAPDGVCIIQTELLFGALSELRPPDHVNPDLTRVAEFSFDRTRDVIG